jgi:ElaA protein
VVPPPGPHADGAVPLILAAGGDELDPVTLYALLRLRAEVFVVEQASPYLDLDGRDLAPETVHMWTQGFSAALRIVGEDGGARRIGRVVTAPVHRGRGLAGALMDAALARTPERPVLLDAQVPMTGWYERYGFVVSGPAYDDQGIEHLPMRLI